MNPTMHPKLFKKNIIWSSIETLDRWVRENGWNGYDPYDVKELPIMNKIEKYKLPRRCLRIIEMTNPVKFRKLLGVKKQVNAKAMGLFADAYLNLYKAKNDTDYFILAKDCINWLDSHSCNQYPGMSWGYPFDWQSKIFIPKGTPSGVVTSIVGNAYWNFFKTTGENEYLKKCIDICYFFLTSLNIDKITEDKLCFSYTPLDNFHVNNANLFVAEFLIKIGLETKNHKFVDAALKAVNYTIGEQNYDGSIYYWGKDQSTENSIDHYHSGFEIRSLYSVWQLTGEKRIFHAVSKYYDFYLKNLFINKMIPKLGPERLNPIDIHSCSEAILCNSLLSEVFPEGKQFLEKSLIWVINNMQKEDGSFIYRYFLLNGFKWKVDIPYIRWGQAWMLNALTSALLSYCKIRK